MDTEKPYTAKAMKDHATTYFGFKAMMKWVSILIVLVLLAMAVFLL
ncbi:MAG: aa3-type cytochrome c oxidase subunit IV [Pacificimonas sp.]